MAHRMCWACVHILAPTELYSCCYSVSRGWRVREGMHHTCTAVISALLIVYKYETGLPPTVVQQAHSERAQPVCV
jgi:hypothetical protein